MLVMTRRLHEAIVLRIDGAPVVIQVTRIAGDRVRLGITAPASIAVNRAEVELDLIEQAAEQMPLVVTTPEDAETVRTLAHGCDTLLAIARTSDHGVAARAEEIMLRVIDLLAPHQRTSAVARARDHIARLFGARERPGPNPPSAPSAISAVNSLSLSDTGAARSLETPPRGAPVA